MAELRLLHTNKNLRNLAEFAEFYNIAISKEFTVKDFFEVNRKYIFSQLSRQEVIDLKRELQKEEITEEDLKYDMTLPVPCFLYVDQKYVTYNLHVRNNNFQVPVADVIAFQNEEISKILQDNFAQIGDRYKKTIPTCRVMGWFKSLHYYNQERDKSNGVSNIYSAASNFIDISPYIMSLNTSVNVSGGRFNITLPHVPIYNNKFFSQELDASMLNDSGNVNTKGYLDKSYSEDFLSKEDGHLYVKSTIWHHDYFNWLIQPNDLLFISFNEMAEIVDDNLSNQSWDMIGLVDSISISKDATGGISVNVSGRDLMKIITDDSRLFFPCGVTNGGYSAFDNTESVLRGGDMDGIFEMNGVSRTKKDGAELPFLDGSLPIFAQEPNDYSIDFVIKAVVSKLANLRIVPEYLFTAWGDKRTKFSHFTPIVEPAKEDTKTTI